MSLRRELTRGDLIMLGLGNIIGAGIFVITSKLIFYGGNYTIFAIIIVSILSLIMGYVYVKLYEKYKTETVEYDAIRDNMGNFAGKCSLFLIYFFAIISCVTITVALTKYITHNGYFSNSHQWDKIITIGLITIICFINYWGITISKIVANTIGGSMLIMLVGIIIIGIITYLGYGSQHTTTTHTEFIQSIQPDPKNGFIIATILSIFLFNGYDIIVKMSTETKNERDTGKATMAAIGITSIIYICVIGTVLYILGVQQASTSYHPLSLVYEKMNMGSNGHTITKLSYIIGGFVMFNTAFISLLGGTRFLYGLVKHKPIVCHISRYQTPDVVILMTFVLAIGLSLVQNEVILAILTNFTVIIILLLLNISYLRIQWKKKQTTLSYICKNSLFIVSIIVFIFLFVKIIQIGFVV
jgi:APA family basic amino acid/polyamine antiporter